MISSGMLLYFGPSIPDPIHSIPISFVVGPKATPETSLAVFSTERYVAQNYSNLYTYSYAPSSLDVVSAAASFDYAGTTVNGMYGTIGAIHGKVAPLAVLNSTIQFKWLNSPITLQGVRKLDSGAFVVNVSAGTVWRFYRVSANEPVWSWLSKAGLVAGDEVFLGYTVPESRYALGTTAAPTGDALYGNTSVRLRSFTEVVTPSSPTTISYHGDLESLTRIDVGGVRIFDGRFFNEIADPTIESIDTTAKVIKLRRSFDPDARVQLTYLTYADYYEYHGFRGYDPNGIPRWYCCDLNPEHGHIIDDPTNQVSIPTATALLKQVLIYLVPTCFMKLSFTVGASSNFTGTFTFDSAYNYGETHFVRHYIGETNEIFDESLGILPSTFYNYWGVTPLNQAEYDDLGSGALNDDVFASFLPSLMPLGKIMLTGPNGVRTVNRSDVRERGGGVPDPYSATGLSTAGTGIDMLRGFYDLGIWAGKLRQDGGVVEIQIAKTVLNTYTREEVEDVVQMNVPPGVHVALKFVDSV